MDALEDVRWCSEQVDVMQKRIADLEKQLAEQTKRAEAADRLITNSGFRVATDLLGAPTIWCVSCGRDGGYHWSSVKVSR